jgi:hypothetical protein
MTAAIIKFICKPPKKERKPNKWRVAQWRLDWYLDFGERLRATRLALGITEAEAAAAWSVTLRNLSEARGRRINVLRPRRPLVLRGEVRH